MSIMIEVFYAKPESISLESEVDLLVSEDFGEITFREDSENNICLTIEYPERINAENSLKKLLAIKKIHIEGPCDY